MRGITGSANGCCSSSEMGVTMLEMGAVITTTTKKKTTKRCAAFLLLASSFCYKPPKHDTLK